MGQDEHEAAVVESIRTKGVTRCPAACAFRTQGTVAAADRAALQDYVAAREWFRKQRSTARTRLFGSFRFAATVAE
jgi:hypothetical protein